MIAALFAACMCANVYGQTVSKDTLVLAKESVRVKTQPVSTGKYVKLSSKRSAELVYRGQKKNPNTGRYSYFVIRETKDGNTRKQYLNAEQVDNFIKNFGE